MYICYIKLGYAFLNLDKGTEWNVCNKNKGQYLDVCLGCKQVQNL